MKDDIVSLKKQFTSDKASLEKEVAEGKKESSRLEKEVARLDKAASLNAATAHSNATTLEERNKTIARLEGELSSANQKILALEKKLAKKEAVEESLSKANIELAANKKRVYDLEDEVKKLGGEREAQLQRFHDAIANKSEEIVRLKAKADTLEEQNAKLYALVQKIQIVLSPFLIISFSSSFYHFLFLI